ncbi:MAG TPA: ABC transporter ATP-binding protein [Bdellovibrionota bacterium]|nr:ABC transporter ATP-binding protein [Bdellovibrionota bacterium]
MPRTDAAASAPAVEVRELAKAFGTCVANAGVSFCVAPGTIHGIIGENGAGKSTAMKMLYGIYSPDSGEILVHGKGCRWRSPQDAIAAGIGMVHQHFMLAGPYTALDNILLGAESSQRGWNWLPRPLRPIDRAAARRKLDALAARYGLPVDWEAPVERLPVGIQQRIEILKLLYREARVLILDEPTAVLTPQETLDLFANLKRLKEEGKTVLIITHKLKEVMAVTDRVTVFRGGKVTGEVTTSETSPQELAELMVGRKVTLRVQAPPKSKPGPTALKVRDVKLADRGHGVQRLKGVSLEVRAGEVVGIAGVEGNGQSELLEAILRPSRLLRGKSEHYVGSGRVEVLGRDVTDLPTAEIKELGVGWIPEDRLRDGLLPAFSVRENFLLGQHRSPDFVDHGLVRWNEIEVSLRAALQEYDVRPRDPDVAAGGLSGGNQQKLIVAREFRRKPRLLVAAQPTRGVDVGAIEFIHERILSARTEGAGVLLVSSELDEVLALSDRILVLYEGQIVAEFERGKPDAAMERSIGVAMGGGRA